MNVSTGAVTATVAVTSETGQTVLVDVVQGSITAEHPAGQGVSHMVALGAEGRLAKPLTLPTVRCGGSSLPARRRPASSPTSELRPRLSVTYWLTTSNTSADITRMAIGTV